MQGNRWAGLLLAGAVALGAAAPAWSVDDCLPSGSSRADLRALKAAKWQLPGDAERDTMAQALLPCLGDADPELRSDFALEALTTWMRSGALTTNTARRVGERLLAQLQTPDPAGFAQPMAALLLAEIARADRLSALWSIEERDAVLKAATTYLFETQDYRGFDPKEGWRHGVADAADLLMQLGLNPALDRAQLDRILDAIAAKVLPAGHFYVFGEGERLARPVLLIARRGQHTPEEWAAWLQGLVRRATPEPGSPSTLDVLARLHNIKAFLLPLYANVQEGSDATLRKRLLPALVAALRALP